MKKIVSAILLGITLVMMGSNVWANNKSKPRSYNQLCTYYSVQSWGGDGSIRFMNNIGNSYVFNSRGFNGKVCSSGKITVELGKRNPGTHVTMKINGYSYQFYPGDAGTNYQNNWHRRYFSINLPYRQPIKPVAQGFYSQVNKHVEQNNYHYVHGHDVNTFKVIPKIKYGHRYHSQKYLYNKKTHRHHANCGHTNHFYFRW